MKKTVAIVIPAIIFACLIPVIAVAANNGSTKSDNGNGQIRIIESEEKAKQDVLEGKTNILPTDGTNDTGLKDAKEKFEKENEKLDKNDKEAYKVLKKYSGKDVKDLITDKYADYQVMFLMCDMLNTKQLATEEEALIKGYLSRRYDWIDDNDTLKTKIQEALN